MFQRGSGPVSRLGVGGREIEGPRSGRGPTAPRSPGQTGDRRGPEGSLLVRPHLFLRVTSILILRE